MYCNTCGNPLPDEARFCDKCGKAVLSGPTVLPTVRSRLTRHLPVLAVLWVVYSALRLLGGGAILLAGQAFGMYMPRMFTYGWSFPHFFFLPGLLMGIGVGVLVLGALGLGGAWGLWQREGWARILMLILGAISLLHFPLGTALGIYTFWVLLPSDSAAEYARATHPV